MRRLEQYKKEPINICWQAGQHYIIKDIKLTQEFKSVYMPAYCCHTMIRPFIDNGISVEFYNVVFENGRYSYEIDFETQSSAVLILQYFGYWNETVEKSIKILKNSGKTIIEDATHSWFSDSPYSKLSDYIFVSFRKWTGVPCGALAIKRNDSFHASAPSKVNSEYIAMRQQSARLKKKYIREGFGQKEVFLELFDRSEQLLDRDYQNYNLPEEYKDIIMRLNYKQISSKRRSNPQHLIAGLKNLKDIEIITCNAKGVPLFVPIIVHGNKRNELRQYLINNDVYCPVHWPLSTLHEIKNKYLYENTLSLVCDQRYNIADMERIAGLINKFYRG